jgi:hypothetical protein
VPVSGTSEDLKFQKTDSQALHITAMVTVTYMQGGR